MKSCDIRASLGTVKLLKEFTVLALSIAALALSATAQQQRPEGNWADLSHLAPGVEIRVVLTNGRTLRGFLQSATSDSLTINATTSQESLLRQDVRRVQLKRQGRRGRNTLIGFAVGAGGGLAFGAVADDRNTSGWFPDAGKQVFTPLGAIIGTVVGVAFPTGGWHDIYRSRDELRANAQLLDRKGAIQ